MKKIIPFSNILKFKTDVSEITAISLEHKINKESNAISGVFYISGEYKIMDGVMDKEQFKFDLPFDIALGTNYDIDTIDVDVDDFRYELVDNNKLKIDIEMYLDGKEDLTRLKEDDLDRDTNLLHEMLSDKDDKIDIDINNYSENVSNNENNNDEQVSKTDSSLDDNNYVTYRVYRVNPGDTVESIISKYEITKEDLMDYNDDLDNIKPGDKLIIQSKK